MTTNDLIQTSDDGNYMGSFWAELCTLVLWLIVSRSAAFMALLTLAGSTAQL